MKQLIEAFALRLCDLSDNDFGGAERAFKALSEGRKITTPSDRVRAEFAIFTQDLRLSREDTDALRQTIFT